jgi:hypothetical protein
MLRLQVFDPPRLAPYQHLICKLLDIGHDTNGGVKIIVGDIIVHREVTNKLSSTMLQYPS